jgi:hypothetical protein
MPGASCTRSLVCGKGSGHTSIVTTGEPSIRHSLRSGFTTYSAISPVFGLFSHRPPGVLTRGLTPASRGQDHAAWSYASAAHHLTQLTRPPLPASRIVTIGRTSLFTRRDFGYLALFLVFGKRIQSLAWEIAKGSSLLVKFTFSQDNSRRLQNEDCAKRTRRCLPVGQNRVDQPPHYSCTVRPDFEETEPFPFQILARMISERLLIFLAEGRAKNIPQSRSRAARLAYDISLYFFYGHRLRPPSCRVSKTSAYHRLVSDRSAILLPVVATWNRE